jgi:riboflavin kinase/FMN adenylyltransferase
VNPLPSSELESALDTPDRPHSLVGTVVRGEQRGRKLGYPTANVPTRGRSVPADGVYAGWLQLLDACDDLTREELHPVAISVGTNPTFDGDRERRVEAHVLDRADLDLYDQRVEISFVAHIRGMVRFDGSEALLKAMAHDVELTRDLLGLEFGVGT